MKIAPLLLVAASCLAAAPLANTASAQTPNAPEIKACQATGLIALQEGSPSIKDLIFDMESLAVTKANTTVGDIPLRIVIMGEAYFERERTGKPHRFVCLIGEKGKVLLTFFTEK